MKGRGITKIGGEAIRGMTIKTKLTLNFMKRKMEEYDILKKELNNVDYNKTKS